MDKRTELNTSLKEALKNKDNLRTSTIRLILAGLKDRDIDARAKGNANGIAEGEILSMMQSMLKQRQESSKVYKEAGRIDLAEREDAEIVIIQGFLPNQMDSKEVENVVVSLIQELGAKDVKDMGKVMGALKTRYAGQLDMAKAGETVRSKLA